MLTSEKITGFEALDFSIQYVRRHPGADIENIGCVGFSFGGPSCHQWNASFAEIESRKNLFIIS